MDLVGKKYNNMKMKIYIGDGKLVEFKILFCHTYIRSNV